MKTLISQALFGKNNIVSGTIALVIVGLIALGCTCGKNFDLANLGKNADNSTSNSSSTADTSSSENMPPRELIDALVAETTADFNYAITTNDFSSMYEKSSPNFQATYTEEEFKNTFKEFVDKKRAVGPILSKAVALDPEYSPEPYMRTEKFTEILVVKGKYPTKPVPMTFEYEYIERDGQWKLLKLIVKLV
jgi:hypothetical protein